MNATKLTRRTRNLGFAVSTTPTGNGTEIATPTAPQITGTPRYVAEAIPGELRARGATGGTFHRTQMFVGGRPVRIIGGDDLQMLVDGVVDAVEAVFVD